MASVYRPWRRSNSVLTDGMMQMMEDPRHAIKTALVLHPEMVTPSRLESFRKIGLLKVSSAAFPIFALAKLELLLPLGTRWLVGDALLLVVGVWLLTHEVNGRRLLRWVVHCLVALALLYIGVRFG